jgi:DNA-binding NarL/FixJ family response regulator
MTRRSGWASGSGARSLRPDACLLDIRKPDVDGIEATWQLAGPDVLEPLAVVVITTFDLDEYVYGALKAGARGFLLKDAGAELLAQAVHAAARLPGQKSQASGWSGALAAVTSGRGLARSAVDRAAGQDSPHCRRVAAGAGHARKFR